MVMILIEKVNDKKLFLRKARKSYYIKKFSSLKSLPFSEIELGLNLDKGQ